MVNSQKPHPTRGRKLPPEPLSSDEVLRLLKACSNRAPSGVRNQALIVVLYRAQLRITEALTLKPKDLDRNAGSVRVLSARGGKWRTVGLDPVAWSVVERWLEVRKGLGLTGRSTVFCTLQGRPLLASYVREMLPRLAKRAGIEKRVHPHGLRHTGAFELANEGVPTHVIQQQLGHTSLTTTDRYIRHLNPRDVVETMKKREWSIEIEFVNKEN